MPARRAYLPVRKKNRRVRCGTKGFRQMFGGFVRWARDHAGLTQVELAERAEVTVTHISHIENGRADPSLALIQKIAKITGTEITISYQEGDVDT